jgi:hypothetical protein
MVSTPASPEQTLMAVAERLERETVRLEIAHDSRAVFSYSYLRLTQALASAASRDVFADPEWVARLAANFAERYFQALEAFDQGVPPVTPWRQVFEAICRQPTTVLEDLVFPMAAHIVHDLPLSLVELGLTGEDGTSHVRDFHLVNDVIKQTIGDVQDAVARRYEPLVGWLDQLGADLDEIATNYGVRVARGLAWYNAGRLLDPASQAEAEASIERSPLILIEEVRHPPLWSLRSLFRLSRWLAARLRRWPRHP